MYFLLLQAIFDCSSLVKEDKSSVKLDQVYSLKAIAELEAIYVWTMWCFSKNISNIHFYQWRFYWRNNSKDCLILIFIVYKYNIHISLSIATHQAQEIFTTPYYKLCQKWLEAPCLILLKEEHFWWGTCLPWPLYTRRHCLTPRTCLCITLAFCSLISWALKKDFDYCLENSKF